MNLIDNFPRSPREKLVGLLHIPRMVDKANAKRDNVLGEYIFPCPIDKLVLEFLGLSEHEFIDKTYNKGETEISRWLLEIINSKEDFDIDYVNHKILNPKRLWWEKIFWRIDNFLNLKMINFSSWAERADHEEGRSQT